MPRSGASGSGGGSASLRIDTAQVEAVAAVLRSELDGAQLRRDLFRELRAVQRPLVMELRQSILSAPSKGLPQTEGGPLRQGIAASIKPATRIVGPAANVSIGVPADGVRRFAWAAKRFNDKSFRRKVYGRKWVAQVGKPRWYDDVAFARKNDFEDAATNAIDSMARRIADRVRSKP